MDFREKNQCLPSGGEGDEKEETTHKLSFWENFVSLESWYVQEFLLILLHLSAITQASAEATIFPTIWQ